MRHCLLSPVEAADILHDGGVVAYPTEAVFGLGADPGNESAVRQILSLKQRDVALGLILIGSAFEHFEGWVGDCDPSPALGSWPGPVTWLFPRGPKTPDWIAGAHDTVAIRVTANEASRELCDAFGGPLVSTSANPHSAPPARTSGEVETYFGYYIRGIVTGALDGRTACSEIRDLASGRVLRAG